MARYEFTDPSKWSCVEDSEEAIRRSMRGYLQGELGWDKEDVERRIQAELRLDIPKGIFDTQMQVWDWDFDGKRLIDVGAGQGGSVLEALNRGADAHGIEPGPEFAALAKRRLEDCGYDPERIHKTSGEALPFPDGTFDYAISLRVLEHVEDPKPLLEEIYRVLRPGGEAVVRCENYLAFREQHYRVPWIPLLPKSLGSLYLRVLGRDPSFLQNYVFYSTYPQIWQIVAKVGFDNVTYQREMEKVKTLGRFRSKLYALAGWLLQGLPVNLRVSLARYWMHARNIFSTGVGVHLVKPSV